LLYANLILEEEKLGYNYYEILTMEIRIFFSRREAEGVGFLTYKYLVSG